MRRDRYDKLYKLRSLIQKLNHELHTQCITKHHSQLTDEADSIQRVLHAEKVYTTETYQIFQSFRCQSTQPDVIYKHPANLEQLEKNWLAK